MSTEEKQQANNVKEKIMTLENQNTYIKKELDEIKIQYDELNAEQKELVDNYDILENIIKTPTEAEKGAIAVCEHIKKRLRNPYKYVKNECLWYIFLSAGAFKSTAIGKKSSLSKQRFF